MTDASVKVVCRFRPINRMERGEWEANRIGELLKIEELDTLLPEFQKRKNKKFQDPRHWRSLSRDTKLMKRNFNMTGNNILRFQRLSNAIDVRDWDSEKRFLLENLGVEIYQDRNQVQTLDAFGNTRAFTFDHVLWSDSTQEDAFNNIGLPIIKDALEGINGTLFAYGQTGSGKTFTSFGPEPIQKAPLNMLGVIPHSFAYLFESAKREEAIKDLTVKIEIVEIYRGKLRDLLEPKNPKKKHEDKHLKVQEVDDVLPGKKGRARGAVGRGGRGRGKKGKKGKKKKKKKIPKTIEIVGVFKAVAASVADIQSLIAKASKNRTKTVTDMNASSSRSHLVLRAKVVQEREDGTTVHANLCFCDLAGSEKVRKTNVVGKQLEEAKDINKQLTCLRNVIDAIVKKKKFVAFKDSMLTRVLQHSLVGNVKTTVLICASPHAWNQAETLSALTFGSRCKLIKNKIVANKDISKEELMKKLATLEKENSTLRKKVAGHKMKDLVHFMRTNSPSNSKRGMSDRDARILALEAELSSAKEDLRHAKSQLKQSHHMSHDNSSANDEIMGQELAMLMEHVKNPMAVEILGSILSKFDIKGDALKMGSQHSIGGGNLLFPNSPVSPVRKQSFPKVTDRFESPTRTHTTTLSDTDYANFKRLDTMMNDHKMDVASMKGKIHNVVSKSSAVIHQFDADLRKQETVKEMMRQPSDGILEIKFFEGEKERLHKESEFLSSFATRLCDAEEYYSNKEQDMTQSETTEFTDFTDATSVAFSDTDCTSTMLSDGEEEVQAATNLATTNARPRKSTMIVAEPDGGLIEIDEDGNERVLNVADLKPRLGGRKQKRGQPMLSDPILDLVSNLNAENIKELRIVLRNARREKGFELNFNVLVARLESWRVADVASFWVILSCQQQKKVRLVQAIGFLSRLEQYLDKKFAASSIIDALGAHAEQFRLVLSTIPDLKFSEIDLDGNDQITIDELTKHLHETQALVVEKLFEALDEDQNGFIDRMEFDVLKTSLQKDFHKEVDENQKRLDMSTLFNEYVGDISAVFSKGDFTDENGALTAKGASHVLHLLRDQSPGALKTDHFLLENDLGLLYLQGLNETQLTDLMKDVPRQIWSQLVETVEV